MDISKPGVVLEQERWKSFAEVQKVGLVSIGFKLKPGVQDRGSAGEEFAQLIDAAVEEKFGPKVDRIAFTQTWGAEWILRAVHADPSKWKFVASRGAKAYPDIRRDFKDLKFPPMLIMNEDPALYHAAREYFMDVRRLDPAKQRAAFVGSNSNLLQSDYLNRFFRQYVGAIISNKIQGQGYWFAIHGDEGVPAEGKTPWTHHSWVPNAEVAGAWRLLNKEEEPPPSPRLETWPFETNFGKQELHIRIPGELVVNEGRPANGVIFWLTQMREGEDLSKVVMNQNDPIIRYAELNSMPVVAWDSSSIWPEGNLQVSGEVDSGTVEKADRAFINIGDRMVEEVGMIGRELGWPPDRWLLTADTAAARYGLMLAQGYSFLAVHLHSATGYEELVKEPSVPWLVTCGWGDGGAREATQFYNLARTKHYPVLFKRYATMGHRYRWDQRKMTVGFFDYVDELKREGESLFSWRDDWSKPPLPAEFAPRVEEDDEGNDVIVQPEVPEGFRWADYAPPRKRPETVGEWFYEALRRGPCVGDWRRGELYELSSQAEIPPWWRVRIPSWELGEAWVINQGEFPELSETDEAGLAKYLGQMPPNENGSSTESEPSTEEGAVEGEKSKAESE